MPGLLDNPKDAAMLQLGLGLLSRSGPSRMPISIGQAIGDAGQEATQTYNQVGQNQQMKQLRDMQIQQQRAQMEREVQQQEAMRRKQAAMQQLLANPAIPQHIKEGVAAGVIDLGDLYKPQKLGEGDQLVSPINAMMGGTPTLVTATPKQPKLPAEVQAYEYAKGQGYQGTYEQFAKDMKRAGASNVNVTTKQETEEAKAVGKAFGESYADLMKSDMMASSKIAKYDQLSQLLDGVNTGKLTPIGTDIAAFSKSIGLNIDPNLGNKQAAEAISNDLALQLRNPSGGAGMPGALSDKDREFLTKMTPGIGKDPRANKVLIETAKKLAQRDKDVAKLARQYRQKKGTLDEGFYEELAIFSEKNPLFSQSVTNGPAVGSVQGGYRFKGGDPSKPSNWEKQ